MEKLLFQDIENPVIRENYIKDNCHSEEEKGYMKPFTPEELQDYKEKLANVSIEISEISAKKKEQSEFFKGILKPLSEQHKQMVSNIKSKAEYVKETCYKYVDTDTRTTGYYNKQGVLVEMRPATFDELQGDIFKSNPKTGTNN